MRVAEPISRLQNSIWKATGSVELIFGGLRISVGESFLKPETATPNKSRGWSIMKDILKRSIQFVNLKTIARIDLRDDRNVRSVFDQN